jgi:hypothetical protein
MAQQAEAASSWGFSRVIQGIDRARQMASDEVCLTGRRFPGAFYHGFRIASSPRFSHDTGLLIYFQGFLAMRVSVSVYLVRTLSKIFYAVLISYIDP